jgi:hypothetical protein
MDDHALVVPLCGTGAVGLRPWTGRESAPRLTVVPSGPRIQLP